MLLNSGIICYVSIDMVVYFVCQLDWAIVYLMVQLNWRTQTNIEFGTKTESHGSTINFQI